MRGLYEKYRDRVLDRVIATGRMPDQLVRGGDPVVWSLYAFRGATDNPDGVVREYVAEGIKHYVQGDASRERLRAADPGLFEHVERLLGR